MGDMDMKLTHVYMRVLCVNECMPTVVTICIHDIPARIHTHTHTHTYTHTHTHTQTHTERETLTILFLIKRYSASICWFPPVMSPKNCCSCLLRRSGGSRLARAAPSIPAGRSGSMSLSPSLDSWSSSKSGMLSYYSQ